MDKIFKFKDKLHHTVLIVVGDQFTPGYQLKPTLRQDLDLKVRLAKREKNNKEFNLPKKYNPRILGPTPMWKICYTQHEAFQMSRSFKKDLHVFSFESESFQEENGKRLFLVTSYEEFWHYYSQLKVEQRHHYEIIPEGSVCHLYFDLEFLKAKNPSANGSVMTRSLMKYVFAMIWKQWGIKCDESCVLQLDSSTDSKFSRHLIFNLKGAAFKDNIHMGHFINHILTRLKSVSQEEGDIPQEEKESAKMSDEAANPDCLTTEFLQQSGLTFADLKSLTVNSKDGKVVSFCDTGVYTKNRNFRLFLSSKLRKNNPLVLAESNAYIPKTLEATNRKMPSYDKVFFMESLIANVEYSEDMKILTFANNGGNATTNEYTNLCTNLSGAQYESENVVDGNSQNSPYPEIDTFIGTIIDKGGVQGQIRRWLYFAQGHLLVYDISKNRWCENVSRQHKSNNVMIVVDLLKFVYYQKCHDPECRQTNYRSNDYPLPGEISELYSLNVDETEAWPECEEDVSDEQLISMTEDPGDGNLPTGDSKTKDCPHDKVLQTPECADCHNVQVPTRSTVAIEESRKESMIPCKKSKLSDMAARLEKENCGIIEEGLSDEHLLQIVEDAEHSLN